jgi:hypothetical protein
MEESDKQKQRITAILGVDNLTVNLKSLTLYQEYLRKNLDIPCVMTGIEDFPWEERYIFGFSNQAEYESIKSNQPSNTDIHELKRFEDLIDENHGIAVKVKRVIDNKRFILDLASLRATDEKTYNYTLLDDYAFWFHNYRK